MLKIPIQSVLLLVFLLNVVTGTQTQYIWNRTVTRNLGGPDFRKNPVGTVSSDPNDIHFNVYCDPKHPDTFHEIIIGDLGSLKKAGLVPEPIIMLLAPFGSSSQFLDVKNAFLYHGTKNIVFVQADLLSRPVLPWPIGFVSYFAAMRNVPKIGRKGAAFIDFLVKNDKIKDTKDVHLVGHSLGAHAAGSIGRYLQERYGMTVGRITGLDVAGPFNKQLGKNKFNKKYGKFVDAIHTDIDGFGTPESLGHADFYVNGGRGRDQVDCRFFQDPFTNTPCAHTLAVVLFSDSVTKKKEFIGCICDTPPSRTLSQPFRCMEKKGQCQRPTLVGENCPIKARGNYYVKVTQKLGVWPDVLIGDNPSVHP